MTMRETANQLLSNATSGDRTSRAIYWPGGQGMLEALGDFDGGTVTLYHAPLWIGQENADEADHYNAQGGTLSGDDRYNLFVADEGYLYLGFAEGNESDDFAAGIGYMGDKDVERPYFVSAEAVGS